MHNQSETITREDIKKAYHFYAPFYDFLFGAVLEPGRRAVSREVNSFKPSHILEIGVGTGLLLDQYPVSSVITGIDISEDMLRIAEKKAKNLSHMSINLETMDAENLKFPDYSFDCVVLPYVLSVTPNPERLITEVRRVCKKEGHIVIVNHFSGSGIWWFLEKMVKNLAERIGFRSEFSYEVHILKHDWKIMKALSVNLFGLSKLIVIRNS